MCEVRVFDGLFPGLLLPVETIAAVDARNGRCSTSSACNTVRVLRCVAAIGRDRAGTVNGGWGESRDLWERNVRGEATRNVYLPRLLTSLPRHFPFLQLASLCFRLISHRFFPLNSRPPLDDGNKRMILF